MILIPMFIVQALMNAQADIVTDCPNITQVYNKTWYSGYLDADDQTKMHYFFFESQNQPSTDPVLLWLNGGPGCSSLLGAVYEHGPFVFNDNYGLLFENIYSWNMRANVLYIQSPAGVGFSQQSTKSQWNDNNTAQINLKSVIAFFKKFDSFSQNQFYIAGQSYGGIYVPMLAYKYTFLISIHFYNLQGDNKINLKGFAVGNGCTQIEECGFDNTDFFGPQLQHDLGFISDQMYSDFLKNCKDFASTQCKTQLDQIGSIQLLGKLVNKLNVYDSYRLCESSTQQIQYKKKTINTLTQTPPCVDSVGIDNLLNNDSVRQNLHITKTVQELKYSMCSDSINYTRGNGSYYAYPILLKAGYKVVIYSGATDGAVPITGTLNWIQKLKKQIGLPQYSRIRPWFITSGLRQKQQVGSVTTYKNFQLITFHGVGHMAPQWNKQGGQKMINHLLHKEDL